MHFFTKFAMKITLFNEFSDQFHYENHLKYTSNPLVTNPGVTCYPSTTFFAFLDNEFTTGAELLASCWAHIPG